MFLSNSFIWGKCRIKKNIKESTEDIHEEVCQRQLAATDKSRRYIVYSSGAERTNHLSISQVGGFCKKQLG
jgi:hypothetical protein